MKATPVEATGNSGTDGLQDLDVIFRPHLVEQLCGLDSGHPANVLPVPASLTELSRLCLSQQYDWAIPIRRYTRIYE